MALIFTHTVQVWCTVASTEGWIVQQIISLYFALMFTSCQIQENIIIYYPINMKRIWMR